MSCQGSLVNTRLDRDIWRRETWVGAFDSLQWQRRIRHAECDRAENSPLCLLHWRSYFAADAAGATGVGTAFFAWCLWCFL